MPDHLQTSAQESFELTAPIDSDWTRWRDHVDGRLDDGDRQFGQLRKEMKLNTEITSEIRDIVIAFGAFARFCKRVGRVLAWCGNWAFRVIKVGGALAASIAAIWGFLWAVKHGVPPPSVQEALPGHEQPQGRTPARPDESRR